MKRDFKCAMLCLLLAAWTGLAGSAQAATRAWLDRSQLAMGETVTLNIESDQAGTAPDLSALTADFSIEAQSANRSMQWINGSSQSTTTYVLQLAPRREGDLLVPAIKLGRDLTTPLALRVAASAPTPAGEGSDAFFETEIDDPDPYVQQSVGLVVRLKYSTRVASGAFGLEPPQDASMQQLGQDRYYTQRIGDTEYKVAERHYVLVPDRSGPLVIPGARFQGRGSSNWMDSLIGGGGREIRAQGAARTLNVRAQPASAPQPWLPLRDLRLRYVSVPQSLQAGQAATLVVEAIALGATRAQMPELPTPSLAGAQVFAEPAQYDETVVDGTSQVKLTRRYSLVPNGAGTLLVPGLKLSWWDVRAGAARTASVPDLKLQVARGVGGFAANTLPEVADTAAPTAGAPPQPAAAGRFSGGVWTWLAMLFAGMWLLTLIWALRRRTAVPARHAPSQAATDIVGPLPTRTLADLRRALDSGSLDEVGDTLCDMCAPPCADLDQLQQQLAEPVQREAVEQLRRARWAGGDGTRARSALRDAFRNGPVWRRVEKSAKEVLPPLYPRA
ncbi:MAG: BatD family protein [Pseudoxanthomonas sp.]